MANSTFAQVALNCRDMRATERFYTRYFEFRRVRLIPLGEQEIIFLKLDNVYLELFQAEGEPSGVAKAADGPHQEGIRHIGFQVDNIDAKLAELGSDAHITLGPLDFDDFIPGWRTVWISDPDGNIVEISQGYRDQDSPPPFED